MLSWLSGRRGPPVNQEVGGSNPPAPVGNWLDSNKLRKSLGLRWGSFVSRKHIGSKVIVSLSQARSVGT
jgi:hypothetical protein